MADSTSWSQLLVEIKRIFSGDAVNIDEVKKLMKSYESDYQDWKDYAKFDAHKYTRNLVDTGNDKYNLIVICWGEGHGSSIHDHADSHCFMKILRGNVRETQFYWPENREVTESTAMTEKESHDYTTNDVAYISDSIGLHRVENPSYTDTAISLHLYSPPIKCCQSFDQRTGTAHKCTMTFYSKYGEKCIN